MRQTRKIPFGWSAFILATAAVGACSDPSLIGLGADLGSGGTGGGTDLAPFVGPDMADMRMRGMFGSPCVDGRDCESGICVDGPIGDKLCTEVCNDVCPAGFECEPIANGGADRLFVCLADRPDLCKSCETDVDCDDLADLCVPIGNGMYCGEDCAEDAYCPDGYECLDIMNEDDTVRGRQCVPAAGAACAPCADSDGDKYGEGADCLGFDCNDDDVTVFEGADELCDGLDNDCDSTADERRALGEPPADLTCLSEGVCGSTLVECLSGAWGCAYREPYESGQETLCDGLDNDCDGGRDEDIDLTSDPLNCAFCQNACRFDHATGLCLSSSCELGPCDEGFFNADRNDGNGCEYGCNLSRGGIEVCDDIDNNCDGQADEGFDFTRDPSHCGVCNFACIVDHATPDCDMGVCGVENCDAGWVNLNGDPRDGCELECVPSNGGVETCDDLDNNCNGQIDELYDLQNDVEHCGTCQTLCQFDFAEPVCQRGGCEMGDCNEGHWNLNGGSDDGCEYACVLSFGGNEACDLADNNCDGQIDEGFDLTSDVINCGGCGNQCQIQSAQAACVLSTCVLAQCNEGFWYLNGR